MKRRQLIGALALAGALAACQAHPANGKLKASLSTATIVPTTAATAPAPTSAPPVPPPPSDEAILGAIPECANGGCRVFDRHDGFPFSRWTGHFGVRSCALHPGYGEAVDGGVYLVSNGGTLVWSTHPTDMFGPAGEEPRIVIDGSGNALVPVSTGAHNGFVGVVRVTRSGVEDFGSFNMAEPFFGNGGPGRVRPDPPNSSPGLDQLLIGQIDCRPSCADGPTTFTVLSWNGKAGTRVTGVDAA